jgi:hypothetical protein
MYEVENPGSAPIGALFGKTVLEVCLCGEAVENSMGGWYERA